jgi:hypothetical protein
VRESNTLWITSQLRVWLFHGPWTTDRGPEAWYKTRTGCGGPVRGIAPINTNNRIMNNVYSTQGWSCGKTFGGVENEVGPPPIYSKIVQKKISAYGGVILTVILASNNTSNAQLMALGL